jgi:hypothetical protein
LDEPTGLEITNGHQNGENPAAATQFQAPVALGPLLALRGAGRPALNVPLGAWRAAGAAASTRPATAGAETVVGFATNGTPGVVRPKQPSDSRPLPVLVDPQTAASAGAGGRLALTVNGVPVLASVVGVLRRFPTLARDAAGFVVADQATLSGALEAQLPVSGRADELWVSTGRPARLRGALRSAPFDRLSSSFRRDVDHQLRAAPVARGVLDTLVAATALSAALAVLGLLLALLGPARDTRVERDLEAQGVGPSGLRAELRMRLLLASVLGVCAGLGIAVVMTRLAVATVRGAGTVTVPRPPLVTVVPWGQLGAWGVAVIAALAVASWLATRSLMRTRRADLPESARVTETGVLGEGVAG